MSIYVKTTLWNDKDQTLAEYKTVVDGVSLQVGQRRRFYPSYTPTDAGKEVVGVFDGIIIRGDKVWVDYLLVEEA